MVPYPARLGMYLRWQYQERIPGIEARRPQPGRAARRRSEELERFKTDIFDLRPALVIWQVGTNAVFHNYDLKNQLKRSIKA